MQLRIHILLLLLIIVILAEYPACVLLLLLLVILAKQTTSGSRIRCGAECASTRSTLSRVNSGQLPQSVDAHRKLQTVSLGCY